MAQTTRPSVWPTEKPFVVFLVPTEGCMEYSDIMTRLTVSVLHDAGLDLDAIGVLGFISSSARHGREGILFLEENGVDTRAITLLMLWGDTAESVNFHQSVPEDCGIGTVILPETGVIIPTVRMPAIENGWWDDDMNQEYAASVYASLIQNGREELDGSEPHVFVSTPWAWN